MAEMTVDKSITGKRTRVFSLPGSATPGYIVGLCRGIAKGNPYLIFTESITVMGRVVGIEVTVDVYRDDIGMLIDSVRSNPSMRFFGDRLPDLVN